MEAEEEDSDGNKDKRHPRQETVQVAQREKRLVKRRKKKGAPVATRKEWIHNKKAYRASKGLENKREHEELPVEAHWGKM